MNLAAVMTIVSTLVLIGLVVYAVRQVDARDEEIAELRQLAKESIHALEWWPLSWQMDPEAQARQGWMVIVPLVERLRVAVKRGEEK